MKFLLIVALALCVCAVSANPGDGQVQDVTYTVLKDANYVLSLQKCNASAPWTIHGLWIQKGQDCGKDWDVSLLAPIRKELEYVWPSCPGHGSTNEQFWKHEWTKHGTCTQYKQLDFFRVTLDVYNRFKKNCGSSKEVTGGECRQCINSKLELC